VKIAFFPSLAAESVLWGYGLTCVAGLDEAGRGAWAGPVAAAAVILPPDPSIQDKLTGVRDSKQMSARERDFWEEQIKVLALDWSTGLASSREIDELGILPSTRLAMRRALDGLSLLPKHLLIDAVRLPGVPVPQTALIKGDGLVLSIACASVLAKTCRDAILMQLDKEYPGYAFARHKGYGTARHREALAGLGPCPEHRFSYRPVSSFTRV
jgi:ribonuclease HII